MNKRATNRLGMFADVKEILDAALAANGGTYSLSNYGAAVHWRHRAYTFRKLFASTLPPGTMSPYDRLSLPRIAPDSCEVQMVIREATGKFTPNKTPAPVVETEDGLLDEALALAEKLSKGDVL